MSSMMRHLAATAVALAAAGTAALIATGPAAAATYPYDGQGPAASGCANTQRVVQSAPFKDGSTTYGYLKLVYSTACATTWAEVDSKYPYQPSVAYAGSATIHRTQDGKEYSCTIPAGKKTCHTAMVNDNGLTSYAIGDLDDGLVWPTLRTAAY
jgi:hypothetical protein